MKVSNREQLNSVSNQDSIWTKIEVGDLMIRVMTDVFAVKEHKVEVDGRWKFPACPTENARMAIATGQSQATEVPPCPLCELGYPVLTSFLAGIIEREQERFDEKTGAKKTIGGFASILKKGQTLFGPIQDLLDDPNWGTGRNYDIKITAVGEKLQRKYSLIAIPAEKSKQVTDAETDSFNELISEHDLEKMTTPRSYKEIEEQIGGNFPEYVPPVKKKA